VPIGADQLAPPIGDPDYPELIVARLDDQLLEQATRQLLALRCGGRAALRVDAAGAERPHDGT
jgi:hypothetical protein